MVKPDKKKKPASLERKTARAGYVFVLPFIIGFFGIYIFTLGDSIWLSFHNLILGTERFTLEWVGLAHYRFAFVEDPRFLREAVEAVSGMLLELPIIILFSLLSAVLLNQKFPGRTFFRAALFMPVILSTGIIARANLDNFILNDVLASAGADFGVQTTGLDFFFGISRFMEQMYFSPTIVGYVYTAVSNIFAIINRSGVQILLFLAGLQTISPAVYESAQIEGASGWESFWKITFPMISPVIIVNTVYSIINALTRSDNPIMMYILSLIGHYGRRNAMAWIYTLMVMLVLAIAYLIISRLAFYQERER